MREVHCRCRYWIKSFTSTHAARLSPAVLDHSAFHVVTGKLCHRKVLVDAGIATKGRDPASCSRASRHPANRFCISFFRYFPPSF